jgi:excisionase family DNA binding protein
MMTAEQEKPREEKPKLTLVKDPMWTAAQVAALLQVSTTWVWRQVRANSGIPFVRLGPKLVRFREADIRRWSQRLPGSGA